MANSPSARDASPSAQRRRQDSGQLPLDLAFRPALGREDFLISACNAAAMQFVDAWPRWPHHAALICGSEGCGKSHLVNVWRHRSGARVAAGHEVTMARVEQMAGPPGIAIEDIDRHERDEQALFHLLNLARTDGFHVLLTARTPPAQWQMRLPDLASRIHAAPLVTITEPDDALLSAVLLKQFADRQLWLEPHVLSFISARMERSMAHVRRLVEALDKASLAGKRKITRQLAATILDETMG